MIATKHFTILFIFLLCMLLPFIGFVVAIIMFSIMGIIALSIHPKWKITVLNLLSFIAGSFITVLIASLIYGRIFEDNNGNLQTTNVVLGYFLILFLSVIVGGVTGVFIKYKILKLLEQLNIFP